MTECSTCGVELTPGVPHRTCALNALPEQDVQSDYSSGYQSRPRRDPVAQAIDADVSWLESVDWVALGLRLHQAKAIELANRSTPDGYPRKTPGASEPPATLAAVPSGPCQEHGCSEMRPCIDHDGAELTSVEQAVEARVWHRDHYANALRNALAYLGDARRAVAAMENRLDELDVNVHGARLEVENQQICWAMARVGGRDDVAHRVVIDGITYALGSWAYKFHRREARLPTIDECRKHKVGKHVMVRAS